MPGGCQIIYCIWNDKVSYLESHDKGKKVFLDVKIYFWISH